LRISLTTIMILCLSVAIGQQAAVADEVEFQTVKAKYFSKDKFVFPRDIKGGKLTVLFLALSDSQENGQYQQTALLEWHAALSERGVFSDDVVPYHFPVLESPPFFVKGIIANAMSDEYEGKVPLDQAGVIYVDDLNAFAEAANVANDGQPTIIIASANALPLQSFKGEVSPEGVDEIIAAISGYIE